jgi:glycosyltransferase involved in cell wall biosynthesis
MVVPPWYELPPPGYGGVEQMAAALVDALVANGHRVTLFGAGTGTGTAAEFVSSVREPQFELLGQILPELVHVARVNGHIADGDFDVVHDHTWAGLLTAPVRAAPTVATVHGSPTGQLGDFLCTIDRSVGLVSISAAQRRQNQKLTWAATVHNGLAQSGADDHSHRASDGPVQERPEQARTPDGPVLWLGRFSEEKGPDLAIAACRAAGLRLVLAGKRNEPAEEAYFDETVAPMLYDGVEVVMNAGRQRTEELLHSARCLLLPIRWEEPFGMVMVEAMAVGTPVVALNRGAVPEVVVPGATGFVCEEPDELPEALHRVTEIDPAACVAHVRTNFSADLMARRYEQVYRDVAAARRR